MRKLYQIIVDSVLADISEGKFRPGQRLPSERELAENFGVSRPTVREAMIALEIKGIVEPRHGSGIYVIESQPAANTVELDVGAFELTEARLMIEGEACAVAADSIDDDQVAELEQLLVEMTRENDEGVQGELADRRFHIAIAQATRNAAVVMVVEMLWDLRQKSPLCANMLARARDVGVQPQIAEHRAVVDALKARDPQGARRAMRQHLSRVIDDLLAATERQALEQARSQVNAKRSELARRVSI